MIEVLNASLGKIVSAVIDSASTWASNKAKGQTGLPRLLDLYAALLDVEQSSKTLVGELLVFADEPVKTKLIVRNRLLPLCESVAEFEEKLLALGSLLSLADPDLHYKLIHFSRWKFGESGFLILKAMPPRLLMEGPDGDSPKIRFMARFLDKRHPMSHEDLRVLEAAGSIATEHSRGVVVSLANKLNLASVDAFDGQAIREALCNSDEQLRRVTELRMAFARFIAENFSLKELLLK